MLISVIVCKMYSSYRSQLEKDFNGFAAVLGSSERPSGVSHLSGGRCYLHLSLKWMPPKPIHWVRILCLVYVHAKSLTCIIIMMVAPESWCNLVLLNKRNACKDGLTHMRLEATLPLQFKPCMHAYSHDCSSVQRLISLKWSRTPFSSVGPCNTCPFGSGTSINLILLSVIPFWHITPL